MAFTAFTSHRLEKGLSLEARPRATTYAAAARLNGKVERMNTETGDIVRAERIARAWFARLKSDHVPGSHGHVTMVEAAKHFLRYGIRADTPEKKDAKREYHAVKWNTIEPFFRAMDVDAVTTPVLKQFMRWERLDRVKPITVRKFFVTLRQILRHATEEGWISAIPVFPRVGTIEKTVQPWFDHDQWARLLEQAEERVEIAKDEAGWHRHSRMDLFDFMRLQVATCLRVDELRNVRVRDVVVKKSAKVTVGGHELPVHVRQMLKGKDVKLDANEYLEIQVRVGTGRKTGARTAVTRLSDSGVDVFRALVKRKNLKPDDLLFEQHCRDAFRELLMDPNVNLRVHNGLKRNLKALRPTGMMRWILDMPHANLKLLAQSWGTSVQMIDRYYLQPLGVQMNRDAIVG